MGINTPLAVGGSGQPPNGDQANAVVSGTFGAVGPGIPFMFNGPFNLAIYASINTALTTTLGSLAFSVGSGTSLLAGDAINSVNVPAGTTIGAISGTSGTLALPTLSMMGRLSTAAAIIEDLPSTTGLVGSTVAGPGIPAGTTVLAILTPAIPQNGVANAVRGKVQISNTPTTNSPQTPNPTRNTTWLTFALTSQAVTSGTDNAAIFTGQGITYSGSVQLERSFDGGATWLLCNVGGTGTGAVYSGGAPISLVAGEPERGVAYRLNCTAYTSGVINWRMSTTGSAAMSLAPSSAV